MKENQMNSADDLNDDYPLDEFEDDALRKLFTTDDIDDYEDPEDLENGEIYDYEWQSDD